MENSEIVDVLNDLVQSCIDANQGLTEASHSVKNPALSQLLARAADNRKEFANALKREVLILEGDPETSGSTGAGVHRAWMALIGTFAGKDDERILAEAQRGEDSALKEYQKALKEPLPSSVRDLVDLQYRSIQDSHDRIKQMRDLKSASTGRG